MKTTEERNQIRSAKAEWKNEGLNKRIVVRTDRFPMVRKLMTLSNRINRELAIPQ